MEPLSRFGAEFQGKWIHSWLETIAMGWFGRFSMLVQIMGYLQSHIDHTKFYKHAGRGIVIVMIVCGDDIIFNLE